MSEGLASPLDFESATQFVQELMEQANLDDLSDELALDCVGTLIDLSGDIQSERGLRKALTFCEELGNRNLKDRELALLDYFRSNAWAALRQTLHCGAESAKQWLWDQPELDQQILCLRRSTSSSGFSSIDKERRCQTLTNLGNAFNTAGRFLDAVECWNQALQIEPGFWMARGCRGEGLLAYARALFDPGHRAVFLLFAHRDLVAAISDGQQVGNFDDPSAKVHFSRIKAQIESVADVATIEAECRLDGWPLGEAADERDYRNWCLRNVLFLNPLNDLATHTIAARDILSHPGMSAPLGAPPAFIGFFDQLKQEFVTARWLYYLGIQESNTHFSDRDVHLHDTLDYPVYGLAIEQVKCAYKYAYALFDKVAFFLNHYLELGIQLNQVSFRTLWREKNGSLAQPIRAAFQQSENWPLRGLFWLSKDLFDDRYTDSTNPDALALHELRIHLEHRYVRVHEMLLDESEVTTTPDSSQNRLSYSIRRSTLETRTRRLLKLARSALIYSSLGVHREEQRRQEQRSSEFVLPMSLDQYTDGRKI